MPTVEQVHDQILATAADLANAQVAQRFTKLQGDFFRPIPKKSVLSLGYDADERIITPDDQRILSEIAAKAIRDALVKHEKEFAGLIVAHARQGKSYFDWFRPT